jgi:hypothetical protein
MIVYSVHGWRHFLVCTYVLHFVCIGEETWNCMHFLVNLSLKTLWAGVKHWRTALHRFYVYRKPIDHLHDLAIWKWFKNMYISFDLKCFCVWCLDNWSRILSGKPNNTFSMARLKTLQYRLTLTPLFTCHACIFFSIFHHFFSWSVIGVVRVSSAVVFLLFSWPSIYVSYWFTVNCEIFKNGKF